MRRDAQRGEAFALFGLVDAGQHDDRQGRTALSLDGADGARHLRPVHAGHVVIQNDAVDRDGFGARRLDNGQRLFA